MKAPIRKTPEMQDAEVLGEMGLAPVVKSAAIERVAPSLTVEQAKTDSINSLLTAAYAKASTLDLSPDEIKRLTADFDDADFQRGAGGDQNLIYLEECALRKRLNEVIGLGKWCVINRRSWCEEFPVAGKPATNGKPATAPSVGVHVYVEAVLLVRGVYVGEAVGKMDYFKSNARQTYDDAYTGAKTAAFRRCCRDFGLGLQAHSKDFCEGWKQRYPGFNRPERKN